MPATSERARLAPIALLAALIAAACDGGGGGRHRRPPEPPPPEDTVLDPREDAPGVVVTIVSVGGASGADGQFRAGDRVRVRFELEKRDGSPWGMAEMVRSSALVSGPSFNYQRVIAEQTDVVARAQAHADGSFTYEFADPIPAAYLAPYNDTPSFDEFHGELAGQPLLAGTYTVGLSFAWDYTVEGVTHHDVGEAAFDFLLGGASALAHREVTKQENCERCHVSLRAHGGLRRSVAMCVLCHTSGAEDLNDPAFAGGTPGTSIDFKVINHKIHNARHLPSVNGVGLNPDGTLDYTAARRPYVLVDSVLGARDYSDVGFPAWPSRTVPMPKDFDHTSLSAAEQAIEDAVRTGVVSCFACHGDPDGAGPMTEPAQGSLVYAQPTPHACQACHDDVDFFRDYRVNQQVMPAWPDNSACAFCHEPGGGPFFSPLAVRDAHLHPLLDPAFTGTTYPGPTFDPFLGMHLAVLGVAEAGSSNGDGTFNPGEKVQVTLTLKSDAGANFPNAKLGALTAVLSGPTANANLVHEIAIPKGMLTGPQPYAVLLPEIVQLELAGVSTAAAGETFATARAPHVDVAGARTSVFTATASGAATVLAAAARAPQNFLDVAKASGFARDDYVAIDAGAPNAEYLRIQLVDGDRLWFSSPESPSYKAGTAFDHAVGASVQRAAVTQLAAGDFTLDAQAGEITENGDFGAGVAVLVTYTTHFVVPAGYPLAANDSPALDETWGEWRGKALADGTYRLALTAFTDLDLNANGEDSFYRYAAPAVAVDLLFGSAASLEPYDPISSADNCLACHQELRYHDATYRDFDACIACHGNAGAEDRPRYVAANAPETSGVTVNFRTLLHQIHRGAELANAATFEVVGAGAGAYPDNFATREFDQILFPALPGRTAHCAKCHGDSNAAWIAPAPRDHPTDQTLPTRPWRAACAACHDSAATAAHINLNTDAFGVESCDVCHGPGALSEVELAHKTR
jgi:hypothetical protein